MAERCEAKPVPSLCFGRLSSVRSIADAAGRAISGMARSGRDDPLVDVIDAAEAAEILGVRREHVVKLLQAGRIPGKRLTATWVTTRQAIEAYARDRRPRGRPRKQIE